MTLGDLKAQIAEIERVQPLAETLPVVVIDEAPRTEQEMLGATPELFMGNRRIVIRIQGQWKRML